MHKHPVAMEIDCQWTLVMKKKANTQPFQPSLHNFSYDPLTFCLWIISSKDHTKDLPIPVLRFSSLEYKQLFKLLKYLTVNGLLLACCVYGTKTIQSAHEGYILRFMDALTNCVRIQECQWGCTGGAENNSTWVTNNLSKLMLLHKSVACSDPITRSPHTQDDVSTWSKDDNGIRQDGPCTRWCEQHKNDFLPNFMLTSLLALSTKARILCVDSLYSIIVA
jgi:hypothetical protein